MTKIISSPQNKEWKDVRRLLERKYRNREKKYLIEGVRHLEEAVGAAACLETVYYAPKLLQRSRGEELLTALYREGVRCVEVSDAVFSQMADTDNPQGILAVGRWKEADLAGMTAPENPLLVVADGVQDPGNLGTIIRSADAAGADGLVTLPGTVDIYNPKTVRSAVGSLFHLPVRQEDDIASFLAAVQAARMRLIVGDAAADRHYDEVDLSGRVALVVGSEAAGPGEPVRAAAAATVKIPLLGRAESLNVGVAASILLYEAVRQRKKNYSGAVT